MYGTPASLFRRQGLPADFLLPPLHWAPIAVWLQLMPHCQTHRRPRLGPADPRLFTGLLAAIGDGLWWSPAKIGGNAMVWHMRLGLLVLGC
jgi:hypothetical protein